MEIVVFIPATPGSRLKISSKKQDNMVTQVMTSPQVRFVERAGTTMIEDLGRNSPWASEWYCPRKESLPCQGRAILAAEVEEDAMAMV